MDLPLIAHDQAGDETPARRMLAVATDLGNGVNVFHDGLKDQTTKKEAG